MRLRPIARLAAALALASALAATPGAQSASNVDEAAVDRIFAKWTPATPGCAVGVGVAGRPVLRKG